MKPQNQTSSSQQFQTIQEVESNAKTRMEKALADFQHELAGIRTGRASIHLLDNIRVDYYGVPSPLNHVGTVHAPDPTLITIQPYDVSQIAAIEKAIRSSDLGLNPSNDGKVIRIPVPPLTEERRKEIVKHLHHIAEEHRVAVRNIRRECNEILKKMAKDKVISEDDERRGMELVQELTDTFIGKIDQAMKAKEKEVMAV